jgi:hypothetical protein
MIAALLILAGGLIVFAVIIAARWLEALARPWPGAAPSGLTP